MPLWDVGEEGPIDPNQYNAFETADLPGSGDVNAGGGGLTTSSMTNESDLAAYGLDTYSQSNKGGLMTSGNNRNQLYDRATGEHRATAITPGLSTNPSANHPFWTMAILLLIFFLIMRKEKREGENIRMSFGNLGRVTLMALIGFLVAKWLAGTFPIASISPTIEYA